MCCWNNLFVKMLDHDTLLVKVFWWRLWSSFMRMKKKTIYVMFKNFVENSHWGIQNCVLMKIMKPNFRRLVL